MLISNSLRKKGGIYIKKLKIFLMLFFSIFTINTLNVKAESAKFYEGEYIDGIYMSKYQYSTQTIFYQKARFFRKVGTNEYAYCIEPFAFFNESANYESTLNPNNLTNEQKDRISKIAYFGYGYENHRDIKWYAITQFMIWQTSDNSGEYYFTDSLNGNRVDYFREEINEINYLIDKYNQLPSIANKEFTIVENWNFSIDDEFDVLKYYKTDNKDLTIHNNTISLNKLKEGNYSFNLFRNENKRDKPIIFYQSNDSQNLMKTGDLNQINTSFKVKVIKTKLELTKLDKDTNSIIPSGNAKLDGAKYMLYDKNMKEIKELTITNNKAYLENLYFGKYFLKEITPGEGYTLDNNIYEININKDNNNINLQLTNEVIKKKIIINKKFGENNSFHNEKNIEFDIYDKFNNYIKTIKTNELGIAEIILPYGEYTFIQKNTTTGYQKVNPFEIIINNTDEETIELKDFKIPVPNTHTNIFINFLTIIFQIILLIC